MAYKFLASSPILHDSDLIEVVCHRTMQHQLVVAIRKDVSEEVSAALVEAGTEDVIVTLLYNQDARISADVLDHLAEESKFVDSYQKPFVRRSDFLTELAERMCYWVSAAVRNYIVENFDVDIDDLDDQMSATISDALETKKSDDDIVASRPNAWWTVCLTAADCRRICPEIAASGPGVHIRVLLRQDGWDQTRPGPVHRL
ncbi:MAG: DUF2336 domain-containing protein [Alphaproteobacteria bacterium]